MVLPDASQFLSHTGLARHSLVLAHLLPYGVWACPLLNYTHEPTRSRMTFLKISQISGRRGFPA